ncbi:VWA domain-containing protein [Pseudenhygromyxa sp. WMMC2535]|uniref:vWA domain-containing protein n=1 Tax=Pseudenhygromyxa sp. WMMC2535 TaxID=2712867 RepID=UPI0015579201|nr:VWA domain-containing protein [Pseudenhygromyxa sp. WMMC2535]NVB43046.1 VWA domain-containing protein [Pseudenhygromyxa sp. WMMC2535]
MDQNLADTSSTPTPRWRRPLLLLSGVSLLTLGAFLNADALGLEFEPAKDEGARVASPDANADAGVEADADASSPGRLHAGEEGKMGKPSAKSKSGLYAMGGPSSAKPQTAREFDPEAAARSQGILGVMAEKDSNFLASPYGGAFAVGKDEGEGDIWGGLSGSEVGEAYGVGGLGLVGTGRGGGGVGGPGTKGQRRAAPNHALPGEAWTGGRDRYAHVVPASFIATAKDPKSTFSIDVDTASYANSRRHLLEFGQLPPADAVRSEELINYFDYDYPQPSGDLPFSLTTEVGPCPWNPSHRLVHVGLQGKLPPAADTPARNLVFLLDVSGSMSASDKLPLVKRALTALTEQLDADDRVAIVVYAGAAGTVLEPTSGDHKQTILAALDRLESGGGTNGGQGIEAAYALAERNFTEGGVNRVILATDGDFNVGLSDHDALIELIAAKRETGVFLSVLGFGTGNLNDHTMEQLADEGNGNYAYIDSFREARKVLVEQAGSTLDTIAKDVKIQVEFDPDQVARHRLLGYENRVLAHRDFDDDSKDAGEIGAGHTVTAIYEIEPAASNQAERANPDEGDALMQLALRYKQPRGSRSRKLGVEVFDDGHDLAHSSADYRFSAAVAAFGDKLRGVEDQSENSYADILALAEGALADDPGCYRHEFLELVWKAATISGETLPEPNHSCDEAPQPTTPSQPITPVATTPEDECSAGCPEDPAPAQDEPFDWAQFTLEVLRLLPPLLALPMFVMALRRPRRPRRGED